MAGTGLRLGGHLSGLEIDVEDTASTLLKCRADGRPIPVHVHQDYLQKPAVRRCDFIAEKGRLQIDLLGARLQAWDADGQCCANEDFSAFARNEMFWRKCGTSWPASRARKNRAFRLRRAQEPGGGGGCPQVVVFRQSGEGGLFETVGRRERSAAARGRDGAGRNEPMYDVNFYMKSFDLLKEAEAGKLHDRAGSASCWRGSATGTPSCTTSRPPTPATCVAKCVPARP